MFPNLGLHPIPTVSNSSTRWTWLSAQISPSSLLTSVSWALYFCSSLACGELTMSCSIYAHGKVRTHLLRMEKSSLLFGCRGRKSMNKTNQAHTFWLLYVILSKLGRPSFMCAEKISTYRLSFMQLLIVPNIWSLLHQMCSLWQSCAWRKLKTLPRVSPRSTLSFVINTRELS